MIAIKSGFIYRDSETQNSYIFVEVVGDGAPAAGIKLSDIKNTSQYPEAFEICPGSKYTDLSTGNVYLFSEAGAWNKVK